jgi:hypothetical protein
MVLLLILSIGLGCSDDDDDLVDDPPVRTTEDLVLNDLEVAWNRRDTDAYADLLADDFRYYPDDATRQEAGVESWDRGDELAYVDCLFQSEGVTMVRVDLSWAPRSATPAGLVGPRASWTRLFLTNDFIDVDYAAPGAEIDTYRVEDQTQRFYFRRGRTFPPSGPADTLMYLVEWRDDGPPDQKPFQAVLPTSWSRVKRLATECDSFPQPPSPYLPQTSEDNVLENFQTAIRKRNVEEYLKVFSTDFQFYLDPSTRNELGIEFWALPTEAELIACWFGSDDVVSMAIDLNWVTGSATDAGFLPPREGWKKLSVNDVFLDVDFQPSGQELTTFRVEDQTQRFFFRKGRTYPPSGPADTLIYIVEWRDQGTSFRPGPASVGTTWSGIKTLFNCSGLSASPIPTQ